MIDIPNEVIDTLGKKVALANNASFLWRQLAQSPTVINASLSLNRDELRVALLEALNSKPMTEATTLSAYVALAALLQQSLTNRVDLEDLEALDNLYWAKPLLDHANRIDLPTERATVVHSLSTTKPELATSSSTSRLILPYSSEL